jgi:bla regulator protein blaR1
MIGIHDLRIVLMDAAWKSAIVLSLTFAASYLLRRRTAAFRHALWASVLASLLGLPAVRFFGTRLVSTPVITIPAALNGGMSAVARQPVDWNIAVALLWGAGVLLVLLRLGIALGWSRRLRASSVPLDANWPELAGEEQFDIRHSAVLSLPVVTGIFRPRILLPSSGSQWPREQLRAVVAHEMAHVLRHDCLINVLLEFVCALFWFQPLVWLAARRCREEAENACDDHVLAGGAAAADYAGYLLSTARAIQSSRIPSIAAAAVSRCSTLEKRLRSILEPRRNHSRLGLRRTIAVLLLAPLCVLLLSSVSPAIAQAQDSKRIHRVGEDGVTAPRVVYKVEPTYTDEARDARIEGSVVLSMEIDTDGLAKNIEIVRSLDAGLDQNGIDAVQQWRFEPGQKGGQAVRVAAKIEINFHLE